VSKFGKQRYLLPWYII